MAKIDFQGALRELSGQPIGGDTPLTLGTACATEVFNAEATPGEKVSRYELAMKVNGGDAEDLSNDDLATIGKCVAEVYPPLLVGQIDKLLNGKPTGLPGCLVVAPAKE